MFTLELYARVRRAVMAEGLSRREAARRFGVHRNTITKGAVRAIEPVVVLGDNFARQGAAMTCFHRSGISGRTS